MMKFFREMLMEKLIYWAISVAPDTSTANDFLVTINPWLARHEAYLRHTLKDGSFLKHYR